MEGWIVYEYTREVNPPLCSLTGQKQTLLIERVSDPILNCDHPVRAKSCVPLPCEQRPVCPGVVQKLNLKGVGGFAVNADLKSPVLAAFVPEGKGIPGFIGLWRLLELKKTPSSPQPYSRRSFFRVSPALLHTRLQVYIIGIILYLP